MDVKREHKINLTYIVVALLAILPITDLLYPPSHLKTIHYSESQALVAHGEVPNLVLAHHGDLQAAREQR